jgi:hypothetical protein
MEVSLSIVKEFDRQVQRLRKVRMPEGLSAGMIGECISIKLTGKDESEK